MKKILSKVLAFMLVLALVVPTSAVSAASNDNVYVVKAGDTLNKIAAKYDTTAAELGKLNNIKNLDLILVGQKLVLPSTEEDLTGKTIILHSNDVHGAVAGYTYMRGLKAQFRDQGAEVVLVDAGDYSQGTTYVSVSKGKDAVKMMNKVGYDVVTLGNHEFDYGYAQLVKNMKSAKFNVICSDVFDADGATIFPANYTYTTKSGVKIGFIGMETPEAQTKANPALIKGLTFASGKDLYKAAQTQVDALKGDDIVIALSHLGVDESSKPYTSYDLLANTTGIDFVIDAHSHTVMEKGENGEPIQSTGTAFANIGVIVIDDATKKIESNYLFAIDESAPTSKVVTKLANKIIDKITSAYGTVFATSEVDLNGDKDPGNRTQETNQGDLITDAMVWQVTKDKGSIAVDNDHVVAITNGGGIRAWIHKGDVTKNDVNTVLPFGNTIAVIYVTGAELLESLEASTFCTPVSVGGFPQISGMDITIDTTKEYKANAETYPASTYYGPASIERVTINNVNGKPFSLTDKYAVITNNFCAGGGDTYYAFASASSQFDTGIPLDEAVMAYITEVLDGTIGAEYAEPQGRMNIITAESKWDEKVTVGGLDQNIWTTKYGNLYCDCKASNFFDVLGFTWGDIVTVTLNGKSQDLPVVPTYSYVDTGSPAIIVEKGEDGNPKGYVSFAINMGDFTTTNGIATKGTDADGNWFWTACDGVTFPISVEFKMKEAQGYAAEYILHDLSRTNERADYAKLSDEAFANFREVKTTGMGAGKLYRSSNPVNPELARNEIADKAAKAAGVKTFINLADSEDELKAYAPYADSYYATQKVIALCLGVDFSDKSFQKGLAKGFRFMIENEAPYLVHCTEGKDRAGFTTALLECLMGATYEEVCEDYMVTYFNYYGIEKGTEKYTAILNANIVKTLQAAFGVKDLATADLAAEAADYIKEIGLTADEISALKAALK